MPRDTFTVDYGQMVENYSCDLCAEFKARFGCLIDPNGHKWRICADCINRFWHTNHFVIKDEEVERRAAQLIQEKLLGPSHE